MTTVVGVKFKEAGKLYYFSPGENQVEVGDNVIVETARGLEFGKVTLGATEVKESDLVAPLKSIIRKANEKDRKKHEENLAKKEEAMRLCQEKVDARHRREGKEPPERLRQPQDAEPLLRRNARRQVDLRPAIQG